MKSTVRLFKIYEHVTEIKKDVYQAVQDTQIHEDKIQGQVNCVAGFVIKYISA